MMVAIAPYEPQYINSIQNPRMEATTSIIELARNYLPNPSMETTSSTVELARNYYPDPNIANLASNTDWQITPNSTAPDGSLATKFQTLTDSPTPRSDTVVLAPNTYTVRGEMWLPASATPTFAGWRAGGAGVNEPKSGPNHEFERDQWVQVEHTFTIVSSDLALYYYLTGMNIGEAFWWRNVCIVVGVVSTPAFSGDTPDDATFTFSWTGSVNASASIKTARVVENWIVRSGSCLTYQYADGYSGSSSAAIQSNGDLRPRAQFSGLGVAAVPFVVGDVLTAVCRVKPLNTARQVTLWLGPDNAAGGYLYNAESSVVTEVPANEQWTDMRITWTATNAGAACIPIVEWANTEAGHGDLVLADTLMVIKNNTSSDYFDGDTPDDATFTYSWSGTPGSSESIKTAMRLASFGISANTTVIKDLSGPIPAAVAVNLGGGGSYIYGGAPQGQTRHLVTPGHFLATRATLKAKQNVSVRLVLHGYLGSTSVNPVVTAMGGIIALTAGQELIFEALNAVVPEGVDGVLPIIYFSAQPTGLMAAVTEFLLVASPTIFNWSEVQYFDGSSHGCSWEGEVDSSNSIRPEILPWSQWDGEAVQPLEPEGVWDGMLVEPETFAEVEVTSE